MLRLRLYSFSRIVLFLIVSFLLFLSHSSPALGQMLQVFIEPEEAVSEGAQWKIVGEDLWYYSGDEAEVALGQVEIEFKDLPGWAKPPNQKINVTASQKYTTTGIYQLLKGTIQVFIEPQEAVEAGAQWKIIGEDPWYNSGDDVKIVPGLVEVEFKFLFGWIKPSNQTINVTANQKYTATGTYQRLMSHLTVNIRPKDVTGTAKWRIRELNPNNWYSSGQTIQVPYGTWTVEFNSIRGYIPPNPKSVTIASPELKSETAAYEKLIVGNVRIIANILTKNGNLFTAKGTVRLTFKKSTTAGYTDEIIAVTGMLSGKFTPPIINGNGAISANGSTHSLPLFLTNAFFQGSFSMDATTLEVKHLEFKAGVKFMGFDLEIKRFKFMPDPFYLSLGVDLVLPTSIFGGGGYIHLNRLDLQKGQLPTVIGRAQLYDCNIFDWIVIEDTYIDINTTTKSFTLNAGLIKLDELLPPVSGTFKLVDGKLAQLRLAVYDADIAFLKTVPLYLQDLGFDLRYPSRKLGQIRTNIRFTVLPNDIALAELEGDLLIGFTGEIEGNLASHALLGFRSSSSYVHFIPGKSLNNNFSGKYVWGLVKISGATTVTWKPKFSFSGSGSGTVGFSVPKWAKIFVKKLMSGDYIYLADATVAISRGGFDASAKVLKFIPLKIHFDSAKATLGDVIRPETAILPVEKRIYTSEFSADSNTYLVKSKTPGIVFTGIAEQEAPYLVLIQPDGKRLDPKGDLPPEGKNFKYRYDEEDNTASFLIGKPMPGTWIVNLQNAGEAGKTEIYFFKANNDPRIILDRIEKITDKYYRVFLEAYDPDNKAMITLFWDNDNRDFNGIQVGTALEKDGPIVFDWEPTDDLMNSGYLYVEIDDGRNPVVRAYFKENIKLTESPLPRPRLQFCKVVGDTLILGVDLNNQDQMDFLKVYYSSNLEQEVLTTYVLAPVQEKIKLREGGIKPGRIYQLQVAALDKQGGETKMSNRKKIKYLARKGNNHPYFTSSPILEAEAGKEYVYEFRAIDWDNDSLNFMLESAPEGMSLDSTGRTLYWTPGDDDVGDNFVVLSVSDGRGGKDTQVYTLKVSTAGTSIVSAETKFIQTEFGSGFEVQVIDHLANADSSVQDELEARVVDEDGYEELRLVLHETSANSGIFRGNFDLNTAVDPVPYWLLSNRGYSLEYELVVSWELREGRIRKIRTVLD